jgi:tetratricopeptide (TPR) repeat protein
MKFSESADYMLYIDAKARGDIFSAKRAIEMCIVTPEFRSNRAQHAYLLQLMGKLYFDSGNTTEALQHYHRAEDVDPESLLVKLFFAKFLVEQLNDKQSAIAKCEQIISLALENPFPESDDDFGSAEYIEKAKTLKATILMQQTS